MDTSSVLYGILVRTGGGLGGVFRNAADAGINVLVSAFETTKGLGSGAWEAAGAFGGGLFTAVHGIFTADLSEMADGLTMSTWGMLGKTAGTLLQAGEKLMDTVLRTATQRSRAAQAWRGSNHERWLETWKQIKETVKASAPNQANRGSEQD